jgi:hypothetical protein
LRASSTACAGGTDGAMLKTKTMSSAIQDLDVMVSLVS